MNSMQKIKSKLSSLNKIRKEKSIFVSRQRYNHLLNKYESLTNTLNSNNSMLSYRPNLKWEKEYIRKNQELCIFVSYAKEPLIKSYVEMHIQAFLSKGIDVILIINTDTPEKNISKNDSIHKLSGICIRENIGFDFGAWSQIMRTIEPQQFNRIYWVNDSLLGPIKVDAFNKIIESIRSSPYDLIGLTENHASDKTHLQSFFLSFNKSLLCDSKFLDYSQNLLQLPSKELVIDIYEKNFTSHVTSLGYTHNALFLVNNGKNQDHTYKSPRTLFNIGFPYVKTMLVKSGKDEGLAQEYLPQHLPLD